MLPEKLKEIADFSFPQKIRALREGKTQQQAANGIGIPRSRLASYEEARAEPPYSTLVKIAKYYNLTTDYLLTGKEVMQTRGFLEYLYLRAPKSSKDAVLKLLD